MSGEAVVFVEIPSGSRNKYEWDEELGGIVLDPQSKSAGPSSVSST